MLAAIHHNSGGDIELLFVILAIAAFAGAVYCAVIGRIAAAAAAAFIGILILLFAA